MAVYSEADKLSLHVQEADEAVCVGPAPALQSYLQIPAILEAVHKTGAQAVHPGYGFLSENCHFVEQLEAAGVNFIGPPASAIKSLGDKIESKRIARDAGLTMIPGWVGAINDGNQAKEVAREMGYPVMIKASAGGGGKGMRIAYDDLQLLDSLQLCKAEALSAFGDDTMLIEKYIERGRHIEMQVLGDQHGHLLYLPERDCSVQRRNQKVVEESPSPFVHPEMRRAMGQEAVRLARAVGYFSTGTVEFIVDSDRGFYFLEMNTRLQVEHPVTEAVTGLDLVEQMIKVAAGRRLDITQERAANHDGWAIETRVYAENPARDFMPSPGRIKHYREPRGRSARVDTGVQEGTLIPMYYDPMIAKLITHGRTRADAIREMQEALDRYVIRGVTHNLPFLRSIFSFDSFLSGSYTTAFIPEHYLGPSGLDPEAFPLQESQLQEMYAAACFLYLNDELRLNPHLLEHNRTTELSMSMRDIHAEEDIVVTSVLGRVRKASVRHVGQEGVQAGALEVQLPDRVIHIQGVPLPAAGCGSSQYSPHLHTLKIDDRHRHVQVISRQPRSLVLQYMGAHRKIILQSAMAEALSQYMPAGKEQEVQRVVTSPMTGTLVKVAVKHGDTVEAGDELAVIEAMKMRNSVKAEKKGYIDEVMVTEGQMVVVDQPLVRLW